jgi:hypothetical protein
MAVFYPGWTNELRQWYWGGSNWSNQALGGTAAANTKFSGFNSDNGSDVPKQWVYYVGTNGNIWQWYWGGSSSSNTALSGGQPVAANTSPAALKIGGNTSTPRVSVFYTGANNQLQQWYWGGSSWVNAQLSTGTDAVGAGTSPTAVNYGRDINNPKQSVFYVQGTNSQLREWHWNGSSASNVALPTGKGVKAGTSPAAVVSGSNPDSPKKWVYYVGVDDDIWQWHWDGSRWTNYKLGDADAGAYSTPSVLLSGRDPDNPKQWVFFKGTSAQVDQWYWNGSSWNWGRLTGQGLMTYSSPTAVNSGGSPDGPKQWVYYIGNDGHIWQWYWGGSNWTNGKL